MGIVTATVSPSNVPTQRSDQNSQGTELGASPTDKISFYGATPVVQQGGNAQAAIGRGISTGAVVTFATTSSPASLATLTTAETSMTLVGGTGAVISNATGDLIVVNKPTSQAGIGIGNMRSSAANTLGVTFSNLSSGFLTPTASEVYGAVVVRGLNTVSTTLTPTAVAASTTAEQQFAVTGLRAGELVVVNKASAQAGLDVFGARVVSNNVLGITFGNVTSAGPLTPTAAQSYSVISLGGIDAVNNELVFQVTGGTVAAVVTVTTAQRNLTINNLAVTDIVKSVSKPTLQTGLFVGGGFISTVSNVGITFVNLISTSLTPTANEAYTVAVDRLAPAAPMVLYSQTLTPAAVAANTTAEQTFAVTGIVAGSSAWVNKPSITPGLGIAGCRVSSSGNIAINFANLTSASITPPAETYLIGNFQQIIDATGNAVMQTASTVEQQTSLLVNSMRSAMTNLGLIAGA